MVAFIQPPETQRARPATGRWGGIVALSGLLFILAGGRAFGQAGAQSVQRDPLMSLMLTQPKIAVVSNVTAVATFDPPVVRAGRVSIYRVTFNALEESIEWKGGIPAPDKAEVTAGAHGQIFQMDGRDLEPRTTFLYHVRVAEPGRIKVPEFNVTVYGKPVTVPAAELEVSASVSEAASSAQRLVLEFGETNVFVGQAVPVSVRLPASAGGLVQGVAQVQLTGEGFLTDQAAARQRIEMGREGTTQVPTYVYETTLIPITAGKLQVSAQGFAAGNRFTGTIVITGPATIPGGPPLYTLLDSDPAELEVQPLPRSGLLPGFAGAVGSFAVDVPKLATNVVNAGDPVKLTVAVRGKGNLARLVAPPPPKVPDWQVLAGATDNMPPQIISSLGFVTFTYMLIPLTEGAKQTPAIPFSCFDPERAAYVDLTIQPVPVLVKPGVTPVDVDVVAQAEALTAPDEKEPVLSGLATAPGLGAGSLVPWQLRAWFPFVQIAPGLGFLGLWAWDRRRRYLEAHPDVVRRRKARHALHKELRGLKRAVRENDAPAFAVTAVQAMRVACAPHYPAEPRALVCADVLPLLPTGEQSDHSAEVVRRFFAFADAAQFSGDRQDASTLLESRPQMEQVLARLEELL